MRNLGAAMASGMVLVCVVGCATNTDSSPPGGAGNGGAGAPSSGASSTGGAPGGAGTSGGAPSTAGAASSSAGATVAGGGASATGGAPGGAGSPAGAGAAGGGAVSAAGTAKVAITSFTLTGCSTSVSTTDLAAKDNGLSAPKPTQSFAAGTFTVDYAASGQYGQVGIDLPAPADLTGCTISVTLKGSSWPACGIYAVPFFFDGTLGTVAPFDAGEGRFVGEEISNLPGPATINFKATGAMLTKVGRIGINLYNCASSVTVGDLSVAK